MIHLPMFSMIDNGVSYDCPKASEVMLNSIAKLAAVQLLKKR